MIGIRKWYKTSWRYLRWTRRRLSRMWWLFAQWSAWGLRATNVIQKGTLHCSQLKFSMWLKYPDLWHFFRWTYRSFPSFLLGRKSPSNTCCHTASKHTKIVSESINTRSYTFTRFCQLLKKKKQQAKNDRNHRKMSLEIHNVCLLW